MAKVFKCLLLAIISFFVIFFFFTPTADRYLGVSFKNGTEVSEQLKNGIKEVKNEVVDKTVEKVVEKASESVSNLDIDKLITRK